MEKLLLYHLLNNNISPNDIKIEWIENPLLFTILRIYQKYFKKNKQTLNKDDLLTLLKSSLSNSEFLKTEAYIKAALKSDSDISSFEVIQNLKRNYTLKDVEGIISEIADATIEKDIDALHQKANELKSTISSTIEKRHKKLGSDIDNNIFMLPSALPTLNSTGNKLCGVSIIGAPSGVGKSAYSAMEVVSNYRSGRSSVYFSLELPAKLLEARILSNMAEVPLSAILSDLYPEDIRVPLSPEYQEKIDRVKAELLDPSTPDIFIFDDVFTSSEMEGIIRTYNEEYGVELFIIDYLNLMSMSATSDGSTWQSKANFVRELNQLCLELGIVVLLPTQIDIEKETDGSLKMRTRGTTELLNTASLALLLYRPPESEGMLELVVTKSRNAVKCTVALADELKYQRFVDLGQI